MGSAKPIPDPTQCDPIADTAPCVGCGLCCDGTMFAKARAEPEEEARMANLGL
jgi:hypothetical protein